MDALLLGVGQEALLRGGEQGCIPLPTVPVVRRLPVGVDRQRVERDVVGSEGRDHGVLIVGGAVGVVAREPHSERVLGQQRRGARQPVQVPERLRVVVSVNEQVAVLDVAARRPWRHPTIGGPHGALAVVEQAVPGLVEDPRMHLGQRGRALGSGRGPCRAAVARPVGGGVKPAGVPAEIVHVGLRRRGCAGGRDRQRVRVDAAAVGCGAQDAHRVGARGQVDGGGHRRPVVPAVRRRQRQRLDVGPVHGQVDRARRRASQRADVVGVAQGDHRLPGGRAEHAPGSGAASLIEAADESGDALIAGVVGLDVRAAGQRGGAGIANLVERAHVLPLRGDRVPVGQAHGRVVRSERPRPSR